MVLGDEEHARARPRAGRRPRVPPPYASIGPPGVKGSGVTRARRPSISTVFAGPEATQQGDALLDQVTPTAPFDAEHVELLVAVADPDHVRDSASG